MYSMRACYGGVSNGVEGDETKNFNSFSTQLVWRDFLFGEGPAGPGR